METGLAAISTEAPRYEYVT